MNVSLPLFEKRNVSQNFHSVYFHLQHVALLYLLFVLGILLLVTYLLLSTFTKQMAQRSTLLKELSYWQTVKKENPSNPEVLYEVALREYQLGENEQASKDIAHVVYLDPKFAEAQMLQESSTR